MFPEKCFLNAAFALCLTILGACSINKVPDAIKPLEEVSSSKSPLVLKVLKVDSNHDGTTIAASVQAKTDWDISATTLNFTVFKDGNLVDSVVKNLKSFQSSQAPSGMLKKDQSIEVTLSSTATDISDYQLSIGWGNEAEVVVKRSVELKSIRLVDLGVDSDCNTYVCGHYFAVEAIIFNNGTQAVSSLDMNLALKEISSSKVLVEQKINLKPISIPVGGQQHIRLRINQGFPSGFGQQVLAQLEVLNVN